jgi:hypothetical protein
MLTHEAPIRLHCNCQMWQILWLPRGVGFEGKYTGTTVVFVLEGPAQAHIQALNLTEGMCAPAMAWLA